MAATLEENTGEISASNRSVGLAAARRSTLPHLTHRYSLSRRTSPQQRPVATGVNGKGVISAAGELSSKRPAARLRLVGPPWGAINAEGVERLPDGRGLITARGGKVSVTGTTTAHECKRIWRRNTRRRWFPRSRC